MSPASASRLVVNRTTPDYLWALSFWRSTAWRRSTLCRRGKPEPASLLVGLVHGDALDLPDWDDQFGRDVVLVGALLLVRDDGDESEAGLRQHAFEAEARPVLKLHLDRCLLDLALAGKALDVPEETLHEVLVRAREARNPELRHG
jgi:hypothetical protein